MQSCKMPFPKHLQMEQSMHTKKLEESLTAKDLTVKKIDRNKKG